VANLEGVAAARSPPGLASSGPPVGGGGGPRRRRGTVGLLVPSILPPTKGEKPCPSLTSRSSQKKLLHRHSPDLRKAGRHLSDELGPAALRRADASGGELRLRDEGASARAEQGGWLRWGGLPVCRRPIRGTTGQALRGEGRSSGWGLHLHPSGPARSRGAWDDGRREDLGERGWGRAWGWVELEAGASRPPAPRGPEYSSARIPPSQRLAVRADEYSGAELEHTGHDEPRRC